MLLYCDRATAKQRPLIPPPLRASSVGSPHNGGVGIEENKMYVRYGYSKFGGSHEGRMGDQVESGVGFEGEIFSRCMYNEIKGVCMTSSMIHQ